MIRKAAHLGLVGILLAGVVVAHEGNSPNGVPRLDHVFFIMMENHAFSQIVDNPNAPFANAYAKYANTATNYFAVAHPSLTNYLEVNGGSNFGVLNDNSPDWHNATCTNNLASGVTSLDNGTFPAICPIYGVGTDAATPAIDFSNETSGPPGEINIDGVMSIPAATNIVGMTIADQLVASGRSWKSYQESLPPSGADGVNNADGFFSNLDDLTSELPGEGQTQDNLVALYAVKHNPFAYFQSVQEGTNPKNSLNNMVDFAGSRGLYADLASGHVPNYSFIVPNQCNDQHGRSNAGPFCNFDPLDNGTQSGLNPALINLGDVAVETLVGAIHGSPSWKHGNNVIVLIWDENDYSTAPNINQIVVVVDTSYSAGGKTSDKFYDHFSLVKSIEAGFGLPCLNHACDGESRVMSDLFAK